jgi:hypothetical protein
MGIFQCKGNSVQRPSYLTASQGRIRFPCPFPGLLDIHRDNGIQGGIVPGNLRQVRFQHLCGRNFASTNSGC